MMMRSSHYETSQGVQGPGHQDNGKPPPSAKKDAYTEALKRSLMESQVSKQCLQNDVY